MLFTYFSYLKNKMLTVCPCIRLLLTICPFIPLLIFDIYELTLQSVSPQFYVNRFIRSPLCLLFVTVAIFWFLERSVSYQRETGDWFFPELTVYFNVCILSTGRLSLE
jgi:hypothetical protein